MRSIIAVATGLLVGGLCIVGAESLGVLLFPPPPGPDPMTRELASALIAQASTGAMLWLLMGYAMGTFFGAGVAARLDPAQPFKQAMRVGGVLLVAGIMNLIALPHPLWVAVGTVAVFLPAAIAGAFCFRTRTRT